MEQYEALSAALDLTCHFRTTDAELRPYGSAHLTAGREMTHAAKSASIT